MIGNSEKQTKKRSKKVFFHLSFVFFVSFCKN